MEDTKTPGVPSAVLPAWKAVGGVASVDGDDTARDLSVAVGAAIEARQRHSRPRRRHDLQAGRCSSHFFLRPRHVLHPLVDFKRGRKARAREPLVVVDNVDDNACRALAI